MQNKLFLSARENVPKKTTSRLAVVISRERTKIVVVKKEKL